MVEIIVPETAPFLPIPCLSVKPKDEDEDDERKNMALVAKYESLVSSKLNELEDSMNRKMIYLMDYSK